MAGGGVRRDTPRIDGTADASSLNFILMALPKERRFAHSQSLGGLELLSTGDRHRIRCRHDSPDKVSWMRKCHQVHCCLGRHGIGISHETLGEPVLAALGTRWLEPHSTTGCHPIKIAGHPSNGSEAIHVNARLRLQLSTSTASWSGTAGSAALPNPTEFRASHWHPQLSHPLIKLWNKRRS